MNQLDISYFKWNNKESKILFRTIREKLNIKESQLYMPLYS